MALDKSVRSGIGIADAGVAPRGSQGARPGDDGPQHVPFRRGSSPVARALHAARRERGETLPMASEGTGLPVRYLAAFEADAAPLIFRSPSSSEPFLIEYARYLGVDIEALAARGDMRSSAPGRAPPTGIHWSARPPGKGGRTQGLTARRGFGGVRRRLSPMGTVLVFFGLVGMMGLSARIVWGALDDGSGARRGALAGAGAVKSRSELPGGGRHLFPGHLVVALYGSPLTHRLGRLGLGPPSFAGEVLRDQARAYAGMRPVLPALELVSTVAGRHPGPDGSYRHFLSEEKIDAYLAQARTLRGLLIIDVQTGRRPFPEDVPRYERFLRQADVGLALDPEWRLGPGQVPGRRVGRVSAAEVNEVIDYLAGIVRRYDLPQKLLVIHQFTPFMIKDRQTLHVPPEVAVTFDIDGIGNRRAKIANYEDLAIGPKGSHHGIKLYYTRDVGLMAPWEILSLKPQPDLVIYQ